MSHEVVKLLSDDDGATYNDPKWCLVDPGNGCGQATLCTGEYFGDGESNCTYEIKVVSRGGVTCQKCLRNLKLYKGIKL